MVRTPKTLVVMCADQRQPPAANVRQRRARSPTCAALDVFYWALETDCCAAAHSCARNIRIHSMHACALRRWPVERELLDYRFERVCLASASVAAQRSSSLRNCLESARACPSPAERAILNRRSSARVHRERPAAPAARWWGDGGLRSLCASGFGRSKVARSTLSDMGVT